MSVFILFNCQTTAFLFYSTVKLPNIENIAMFVSKHINSIAVIILIIGIAIYIGGIMLSTYIVKRKDY